MSNTHGRGILDQPGCIGVRYYRALNADGDPSMILVGVDQAGDDMTAGLLLDGIFLCPPFCPGGNVLNS